MYSNACIRVSVGLIPNRSSVRTSSFSQACQVVVLLERIGLCFLSILSRDVSLYQPSRLIKAIRIKIARIIREETDSRTSASEQMHTISNMPLAPFAGMEGIVVFRN